MYPQRITLACLTCNAPMSMKPSEVEYGRGKFCSKACQYHRTPEQRFWNKVDKSEDCWIWTGAKTRWGYGQMSPQAPARQWVAAHRFSWEMHFGLIPDGLNVLHHCDNPPCVRPDHLFLGTLSDNTQDMLSKGRHYSVTRPEFIRRGEKNGTAKLTNVAVLDIRRRLDAGERGADLARQFQVSPSVITHIRQRKTWRHI